MSSSRSAILKSVAKDLVPKVKDTRKFSLVKPMTFKPEEAMILAAAFSQVKVMSENPKLTMSEFVVALAKGVLGVETGEIKEADVKDTIEEVFKVKGGAPTILI